jgi:hypothetical protein
MQRDANDADIYEPAPAAIYPARPAAIAPTTQLQAYIEACQAADELRDAQFLLHGRPALNHRPLDSDLKTILLDALSTSRLGAYKNLYQNSTATGVTTGGPTRIYTMISSTTRSVLSLAPVTAMQRSKTTTDLGAHAQAAGAAILTAPVGKHRSNKQHPYVKHNNSQPTHRPTAISTTSHPILVVDRRAT